MSYIFTKRNKMGKEDNIGIKIKCLSLLKQNY